MWLSGEILINTGKGKVFSPIRRQTITWPNADISSTESWGPYVNGIYSEF